LVIISILHKFLFQEISILRAEARQKLEILGEQRQFFRNEVNNNKETEAQISVITRSAIRLRDDYSTLLNTVEELSSEVSKLIYIFHFCRSLYLKI
jgi:chromosome condensin MukBEF ATPase and DNA-binding subunit MukB